jgi:hypothetical protein
VAGPGLEVIRQTVAQWVGGGNGTGQRRCATLAVDLTDDLKTLEGEECNRGVFLGSIATIMQAGEVRGKYNSFFFSFYNTYYRSIVYLF